MQIFHQRRYQHKNISCHFFFQNRNLTDAEIYSEDLLEKHKILNLLKMSF